MKNFIIGIISMAGIFGILHVAKHKPVKNKTNNMKTIYGEVIHIEHDKPSELSRITVKDSKGMITYGYSKVSVKELNILYSGKGKVTIPVLYKIETSQPE